MGRSYEYKSDAASLYIGDLKVPKKYITIITGESLIDDLRGTPLSIKFDSICTTTVNGKVYKLPTRESPSITEKFDEKELLLKVNANKSDRIQLYLAWKPVVVLPFAKRIQFEGNIQPSPLPQIVETLHEQKIDLRTTKDPLLATHYLTMSDYVDFNWRAMVLQGKPVVSTKWTDYLEEHLDDVEKWLEKLDYELILPGTRNDYIYPDPRRCELLLGTAVSLCYNKTELKSTNRLQTLLECTSPTKVVKLDMSKPKPELWSLISDHEVQFVFCIDEDKTLAELIFGETVNTGSDFWNSIIDVTTSALRKIGKEKLLIDDLPEVEVKEELSLPLTQRRKRRKVERVKDTDFFSFSQKQATAPEAGSLEKLAEVLPDAVGVAENGGNQPSSHTTENLRETEREEPEIEAADSQTVSMSPKNVSPAVENDNFENTSTPQITEASHDTSTDRKAEISKATSSLEPKFKKIKPGPSGAWIVPQISLADAIKSTKKQADLEVKQELGFDDIGTEMTNLAIVEEVDLMRRTTVPQSEPSRSFSGRKNFKAFKKNGKTANSMTRVYLELYDDTLANEIRFVDHTETVSAEAEKVKLDFSREMSNVKGYQPSSQLFVGMSDDEETSFLFLTRSRKTRDESDSDDEFAFKFSRA